MIKTVAVLIGNSDNRLPQIKWHEFVNEVRAAVQRINSGIHFEGAPPGNGPRQNYCIVFGISTASPYETNSALEEMILSFKKEIAAIREKYWQDAAAVIVGDTQMV